MHGRSRWGGGGRSTREEAPAPRGFKPFNLHLHFEDKLLGNRVRHVETVE